MTFNSRIFDAINAEYNFWSRTKSVWYTTSNQPQSIKELEDLFFSNSLSGPYQDPDERAWVHAKLMEMYKTL